MRRSDYPTSRQYLYSLHWSEVLLREAIAEKVNVPETFTAEEKVGFLVSQGLCRTDVSLQLDPPSCRCDLHLRCFPVGTRLWLSRTNPEEDISSISMIHVVGLTVYDVAIFLATLCEDTQAYASDVIVCVQRVLF